MGLDLYLMCNLTLKYVKELKHQIGRKVKVYVWFDEEGDPDSFDDWPFSQEHLQVLNSGVFQEECIGSFS